jgi:hypothetical protein
MSILRIAVEFASLSGPGAFATGLEESVLLCVYTETLIECGSSLSCAVASLAAT